jgi:predicted NAD-dependent protein-ADP-ribosyltransferase YbiA (DUF1768 family)
MIERFRGEYFPFSNMYPLPEWIEADCGVLVPTSEHAYMANRFKDTQIQLAVAAARGLQTGNAIYRDGLAAKKLAHELIEAGEELSAADPIARIALMRRVVSQKVDKNELIHTLLVSTDEQDIQEGNDWGDTFWGVSPVGSGTGQNNLGKIYMELRSELKN